WMGTVTDTSIIGHLRELGGDFVGIPFGTGRPMPGAPNEWASLMTEPQAHPIHGPSGDADWTIVEAGPSSITLSLDYPETSPVLRLERTVAGREGEPAIDFTLTIFARRPANISLGLHPNFRLPEKPGRLALEAEFAFGLRHPGQVGQGERQEFASLASIPQTGETSIDMSHVPLSPCMDRNVQLCGMKTPLVGRYLDEGAGFELDWDRSQLPSLMIWHTDGGIGGEPWRHQFRGLGLEPLASAFDLNTAQSAKSNPINRRGIATTVHIDPMSPTVVRHSVRAFSS
ncbi:MAG TPA: hypothetical protein VIN06_07865, partial [Devosia sp.]